MYFNILTNANQKIRIAYEFKPEQITALCGFMVTNDIAYILPTGFRKSIIFQLMPFISNVSS